MPNSATGIEWRLELVGTYKQILFRGEDRIGSLYGLEPARTIVHKLNNFDALLEAAESALTHLQRVQDGEEPYGDIEVMEQLRAAIKEAK